MEKREITVYKFDELSDKAKEKAREWFRESSYDDMHFEWENLEDDAENVGLKLATWGYRRYLTLELVLDFNQVLTKILADHGECCETWKTAKRYKDEYNKLSEEQILNGGDEGLREDFVEDIAEDYRVMADNQYEYIQSDEYIDETIRINEYDFTEDGRRFKY